MEITRRALFYSIGSTIVRPPEEARVTLPILYREGIHPVGPESESEACLTRRDAVLP